MRRLVNAPAQRIVLGLLLALAAAPQARAIDGASQPTVVPVMVDNAKLIRLPEKTQMVIIGNPIIADVSLQKNGVVVLTGKSFGTTNLIALDASGTMIAESLIRVEAQQSATVTVQRGADGRASYSCTPICQPSAQLGDSSKWYSEVSEVSEKRRSLAAGAATAAPAR